MPRAKRPLSEVDPNASNASRKSAKTDVTEPTKQKQAQQNRAIGAKEKVSGSANREAQPSQQSAIPPRNSSQKWSMPGTLFNASPPDRHEESEGEMESHKEQFEYRNKDNSKLRRLLSERCLSTVGTREELISRLENSSIIYEELSSARISEMLKGRNVTMSSQGTKEYKIERLRLNDKMEHDTGSSGEAVLYGRLSALEWILQEALAKRDTILDYSSLKPKQLSTLLERRKLPQSGTQPTLIKRLQNDDQKSIQKKVKDLQTEHDRIKHELETKTGRSIVANDVVEKADRGLDTELQIQHQAQRPSPKPICSYDWKDSHWAGRTERQLTEICSRRGMPGYGPKAAMLKWLDTGNLEYEDLYIGGLESICRDRGLKCKSKDTKNDLIRRLREADEAE